MGRSTRAKRLGSLCPFASSVCDHIDRMCAQDLLRFHGEEIAVAHRSGLHEGFTQAHDGHFDGRSTCLPDAALDLLGPLPEVGVAGDELVPGVEDSDDRFTGELLAVQSKLLVARAMPESAQGIGTEKAVAAEVFRFLAGA